MKKLLSALLAIATLYLLYKLIDNTSIAKYTRLLLAKLRK